MNISKSNSARQWMIWQLAGSVGGAKPRQRKPLNTQTVYRAEAYRFNQMGSFGNASYMLLRQHAFPHTFDTDRDKMTAWDHDRIFQNDYEHARRCFTKYTRTGELGLEGWLQKADPQTVINFLVDVLKADQKVKWTGFRVLGTVNRGNGYPVWTLELFAKHPESTTVVFDTRNAPNLIQGSRYARPEDKKHSKANWTFDEFGVSF